MDTLEGIDYIKAQALILRFILTQLQAVTFAPKETGKSSIQMSIEHNGVSSSYVRLSYFDKINSGIIRAKANDDL